jgi:hypothetical protein
MVTKSKKVSTGKKKKIKVLNLNKETVRELTSREAREIRGATLIHGTGKQTSGNCNPAPTAFAAGCGS